VAGTAPLPVRPGGTGRALELEDYFDEACAPDLRRVLFNDNLAEPEKFIAMFCGPDHPRLGLLKALSPVLAPVVKWRYDIRPQRVAHSCEVVRATFRRVEAEVGPAGYLLGDSFTVADLTAASILAPIVVPPEFPYIKLHPEERAAQFWEFRASLKDHPGFKWVEDMYARHRGTSVDVEA
jgi:glutathione S-transferase